MNTDIHNGYDYSKTRLVQSSRDQVSIPIGFKQGAADFRVTRTFINAKVKYTAAAAASFFFFFFFFFFIFIFLHLRLSTNSN